MSVKRGVGFCVALILLASCAIPAGAHDQVDANWIGGNGYWDDSTHWSGGVVPDNVFGHYRAFLSSTPPVIAAIRQDVTVDQVLNWVDLKLVNGATLTVEDYLYVGPGGRLEGRGAIQALRVANYGEIFASGYGNSLTVTSTHIDNWGIIHAIDYGKLTVAEANITNQGLLEAYSHGTLTLQTCQVNGGQVKVFPDAQLLLAGSALSGNTVGVSGSGMLRVSGGPSEVESVNLMDAAGVAVIDSNAALIVHDTYMGHSAATTVVSGSMVFYDGSLLDRATVTLNGGAVGGAIHMVNNARITGSGLVQAAAVTMDGGDPSQGVRVDGCGQRLDISGGTFTGVGSIVADHGGEANVCGAHFDLGPGGVIRALNGGRIEIAQCSGVMPIEVPNGLVTVSNSPASNFRLDVGLESGAVGNFMVSSGWCYVEQADVLGTGALNVLGGATLRMSNLRADGAFGISGTAECYGGHWTGWYRGGAVYLQGGRIAGNLDNDLMIAGYGQIDCPASTGGLWQHGGIQVAGGVLELRPRTLVNTSANIDANADGELFVNNATIAGNGGRSVNVTGTLRLNNAKITGMNVRIGGSGGGGPGPLSVGPMAAEPGVPVGANMYANGNNDLTGANVTIYEGAGAEIQSGTTAFGPLENRGVMNVRAGATMGLSGGPFENDGTVNIAGVLDGTNGGHVENYRVINVLPGGVANFGNGSNGGTIFVDSGGVMNMMGQAGCGDLRVRGTLNAQDLEGGSIVLEGGSIKGGTRNIGIRGYGTITGNHSGASICNEVNGTLLITDAMLQDDRELRAEGGGIISIVNSVINWPNYGGWGRSFMVGQSSQLTVRDSALMMDGQVGQGGFLLTLGTVELKNVDVAGGTMAVLGETSMARLSTWGPFEGANVYVAPGHKLSVQSVQNDGGMDIAGELHFRTEDFTSCSIDGGGWVALAGGSITGEAQVTSTAGGEGIRGYGRISVPLINYGNVSADAPGSWLKLDVNDKVNYGLILAQDGGRLSVEGIRLDNYGTIQVDADSELLVKGGTIDTKDTNGHIYNAGRITVESGGTINLGTTQGGNSNTNNGEIFVASGGALNLTRTSLEGSGYVRVAGTLNADDVEIPGSGGGAGIVMEGGVLAGATRIERDISGYGTITGNHTLSGSSIYNDVSGSTLLITDAMLQIDGDMRADLGGKISIVNAVINMNSRDDEGRPSFIVQGYEPYPAFSQLTVRDSGLMMNGQVREGGFLLTLGTVELKNVDVAGGMMAVLGETSMGRLSTSWAFEGANVYVAPGHKLTVQSVRNDGDMDIAGELHFRTEDFTPCSIEEGGWVALAGGSITGEAQVTSTAGGEGIRGYGRISVPLINYGNIYADAPGSWLKLDVNDKVNYGVIQAEDGGRLSVEGIRLDNYGLIYIGPDSHLLVDGGIIDNKDPGALTQVDGTLEIRHGGAIYGGHVVINGAQDHFGPALLSLRSGGKAEVNTDAGRADRFELTVSADGPGTEVNFGATQHLAALDLRAGGRAKITPGGSKVLVTRAMAIDANSSSLDVTDNDAIVDYEPGSSPFNQISAWIAQGFNGGDWLGNGITSAETANPAYGELVGIGIADNAAALTGEFSGQTVDDSAVLVKFTWYGDADLNGAVNTDDFGLWVAGFSGDPGTSQTWLYGDFDYNGAVNTDDFALWAYASDGQTTVLSEGFGAAVPEPGTLVLLAVGGIGLLRRARGWQTRG